MWNLYEKKQGIAAKDLERVKKRTKIGDRLWCETLKACTIKNSCRSHTRVKRRGTVIGKYPYFVQVELEHGVTESILWIDLMGNGGRADGRL